VVSLPQPHTTHRAGPQWAVQRDEFIPRLATALIRTAKAKKKAGNLDFSWFAGLFRTALVLNLVGRGLQNKSTQAAKILGYLSLK